MNYVAIPNEIFESPEYRAMTAGQREFVLRLYHLFGDCESFTIDYKTPDQYGEKDSSCMNTKLAAAIKAGFVYVAEKPEQECRGPRQRIMKFKYSTEEAYQ